MSGGVGVRVYCGAKAAVPTRIQLHADRFALLILLFVLVTTAGHADTYLLSFSGGITGSGTLVIDEPCPSIPDPPFTVCPAANWASEDIGIFTPLTGFTRYEGQGLDVIEEDEMFPGFLLPPFFYPTELSFGFGSGSFLVNVCCDLEHPFPDLRYLQLGGGPQGSADFFDGYEYATGTFVVERAPEPGSVALLLTGVVILGVLRNWRSHH